MKQTNINIDEIKRYPTVTNPIKADDLHTPQAYAYSLRRAIVTDCNDRQRAALVELLDGKESAEGVTFNNTKANRDRLHIWQNRESRKERAAILGTEWQYIEGLNSGTQPGDLITCLDGTQGRVTKSSPESCVIEFETADGQCLSVAGYFRKERNNIPAWCKPFTEVYRKGNGGLWHLYDIICATADGVKVRMFEDYSDRIETKTLADIISDGEKIASGEYETETRTLTPKQAEAVAHAFDVLPVGTVVSLEGEYIRITGYDSNHHRYTTTSLSGTGIRAEFMGTYFAIGKPDNKHTAEDLPTWCKVGARVSYIGQGDYTISEISDGIVWLSYFSPDRDREGMSIDAFIWRAEREYITLLEAAPEISDSDEDPTLTEAEKRDTLCRLWDAAWQQAQSDPEGTRVIVETNEEDPSAPANEFGRYYMVDGSTENSCADYAGQWVVIRVDTVTSPYEVHRPNWHHLNGYADDWTQPFCKCENPNNVTRWARKMIDAGRVTDIYADCY